MSLLDIFDFDKKMALINLDVIYEYSIKLDKIVSEDTELEEWVKMKLTRIEQNIADVKKALEGWEKFGEGGMIFKKQLLHIAKYSKELIEKIKDGSKLMSWQEDKLAVSAQGIDDIYHYLDYQMGNRASDLEKDKEIFADGGNIEVANTIIRQIGGMNRLIATTGAYNFVAIPNGVSFKIKNRRANYIKIKLTSLDLYDLEVGRIYGNTYNVVAEEKGLYADMLKPAIERATGMRLSIFEDGGDIEYGEQTAPVYSTDGYTIYEGYDFYTSKPIYRVESTSQSENEYVGEWHSNLSEAEQELDSLTYATGGTISMPTSDIERELLEKVNYYDLLKPRFVGNFGWMTPNKKRADGYLFELDDYDKELVSSIKLKDGEKIFRYINRTTAIGGMTPLIKINVDKQLLYFLVPEDEMGEYSNISFQTRGVKALWLTIVELGKYKNGGEILKKGDRVTDGRGNFGVIKAVQDNGKLYIQWISYSGEPTSDLTADNDPEEFDIIQYKLGGDVEDIKSGSGVQKIDISEFAVNDKKLFQCLISILNDVSNLVNKQYEDNIIDRFIDTHNNNYVFLIKNNENNDLLEGQVKYNLSAMSECHNYINYNDVSFQDNVLRIPLKNIKYKTGGGVGEKFDYLSTPITYKLVNKDGDLIFKTQSFNRAVDYRILNGKNLTIIAIDKNGNSKIIANGYSKGGSIDTDYNPESVKRFSKSKEVFVRENLVNGEIEQSKLASIIGHEPDYPFQIVGTLKLKKAYLRPYYKL